jgi:Xaa-Pro aminopeptidase
MAHDHGARIRRAGEALVDAGLAALVASPGPDLIYLAGYEPPPLERLSALVVRPRSEPVLIVPKLERPRAEDAGASAFARIVDWPDGSDPYVLVSDLLPDGDVAVSDRLWAVHLMGIERAAGATRFRSAASLLAPLRAVKDDDEIALLALAASAADRAFARIASERFTGRTEREVAKDLATFLVEEGHDVPLFTIVGAGANGASPHHEPTDSSITDGDAVVMDFGGRRNGYSSDLTRTVFVGEPNAEMREVYDVVRTAQGAASRLAGPGVPAEDVDRAARDVIAAAGYGDRFIHRTGHGIGLEEHEDPYIVSGNGEPLRPGNTFSIEPGVYLPGRFGVRIEDVVVVTDGGARSLNDATRDPVVVA